MNIGQTTIEQLFDVVFKDFPTSYVRQQYDGHPVSNVLCNTKTGDLKIEVAMTGYEPENIEVSLDDRILIVRGKTNEEVNEHEGFTYIHKRIREKQTFERRFALPRELQLDAIKVKNRNGLLTIDIPFDTARTSETKLKIE